jgi:hypothetical protein
MDKGKVGAALADAGAESVTNIFHCAYLMKGDPGEECEVGVWGGVGGEEAAQAAAGDADRARGACVPAQAGGGAGPASRFASTDQAHVSSFLTSSRRRLVPPPFSPYVKTPTHAHIRT